MTSVSVVHPSQKSSGARTSLLCNILKIINIYIAKNVLDGCNCDKSVRSVVDNIILLEAIYLDMRGQAG